MYFRPPLWILSPSRQTLMKKSKSMLNVDCIKPPPPTQTDKQTCEENSNYSDVFIHEQF